ncbi:MAG: hypothetical protein LBU03_02965 [Tannerellaceae bacterium]|nr:hypothetical protein [Tannerellaceae bacterium]
MITLPVTVSKQPVSHSLSLGINFSPSLSGGQSFSGSLVYEAVDGTHTDYNIQAYKQYANVLEGSEFTLAVQIAYSYGKKFTNVTCSSSGVVLGNIRKIFSQNVYSIVGTIVSWPSAGTQATITVTGYLQNR